MTKTTSAAVASSDRHAAFRARAQEALRERVNSSGRMVLVSTLLAPAGSAPLLAHGTHTGYSEYLCRCDDCSRAYAEYRQQLRGWNLGNRKQVGNRMVSTLLGSKGYPKHGVVTGTYWYGCECNRCQQAKAASRSQADMRAENLTHLVPRADDGVLVSTLLGTGDNPDHGTYSGADWYGCWCEPCRAAKNTLARLYYVLRRNWPQDPPQRGAVSELSRTILADCSGDAVAVREQVRRMLSDHPAWSGSDLIDEVADKLTATLDNTTKEAA